MIFRFIAYTKPCVTPRWWPDLPLCGSGCHQVAAIHLLQQVLHIQHVSRTYFGNVCNWAVKEAAASRIQINLLQRLSTDHWIKQGIAGRESHYLFKWSVTSKIFNFKFQVYYLYLWKCFQCKPDVLRISQRNAYLNMNMGMQHSQW